MVPTTWKIAKHGTIIFIFIFSKNWVPIYWNFDFFFQYIGLWLCGDFGSDFSLNKLGRNDENLNRLVPTPGGGLTLGVVRVYSKGLGKARNSRNVVFYSVFLVGWGAWPNAWYQYIENHNNCTPAQIKQVRFWTLPSLKSGLQNHEGATETRKDHTFLCLRWVHDTEIKCPAFKSPRHS